MSIELVHCRQCGSSSVPFDTVSVTVTFSKSKWCDHCYKTDTERRDHFFCSEACFNKYMAEVGFGSNEQSFKK